jgi:hypothetical protein
MGLAMNETAARPSRRAAYQDVLDAPPSIVAEIAEGVLHLSRRPASRLALAAFGFAGRLDGPFRREWWFAIAPELRLGPEVLVPDLCGWRRERMPEFPDAPGIAVAPDWACDPEPGQVRCAPFEAIGFPLRRCGRSMRPPKQGGALLRSVNQVTYYLSRTTRFERQYPAFTG